MRIIEINEYKFTTENKPLKLSRNYESNIYVLDGKLYKILNLPYDILDSENRMHSSCLKKREKAIIKLMELNPSGCCNPIALLRSKKYFLGCVYPYLKDYNELLSESYPIEVRIELCRKINETFRKLWKLNIQYVDLSANNIMTNGEDIKFVDMDSISMQQFETYEEEKRFLVFTCQQLSLLSLSVLLNLDIDKLDLSNYYNLKSLLNTFDNPYLENILKWALEISFTDKPYFVDRVLDKVNVKQLDERINTKRSIYGENGSNKRN